MFSGQGSQYVGMGRALYESEPTFRHHVDRFDEVTRDKTGTSLVARLYGRDARAGEPFDDTHVTHPALFAVQYALARTLQARGAQPDIVLGSSLGDFVAAALAQVAPAQEIVAWLIDQAASMARACEPGFMLAVLGPASIYRGSDTLREFSDLVGVNYAEHFVIGGNRADLARVEAALAREGVVFHRLPVRFGFHSRNVAPVVPWLHAREANLSCRAPTIPWASCTAGGIVEAPTARFLTRIAIDPLRFQEAARAIEQTGSPDTLHWVDLGPSGTLANFARRLGVPNDRLHVVMGPFGDDARALGRVSNLHASNARPAGAPAAPVSEGVSMHAFLFPGQGSQVKGMGAALFARFPDRMRLANEILGYDLAALCVENPDNRLGQTQFTQPAMYVVNALSYLARREDDAGAPAFVAGHSLGEYSALFAAGAFSFEDGLRLVKKRGELMSAARDGGMAAVLGLDEARVAEILASSDLRGIDIANLNAPTQIVIAGPADEIRRAQQWFEQGGCYAYVVLPVSGAFHSRMMRDAQREFERFIAPFDIGAPGIPVIANVTGRPYRGDEVRRGLVEQIASPVRWVDTIRYLSEQGVERFAEIGTGTVLTDLLRKILPQKAGASGAAARPQAGAAAAVAASA
ncbi:ACP S-malonyltransferase, partial [Burkholderia thailandensis]